MRVCAVVVQQRKVPNASPHKTKSTTTWHIWKEDAFLAKNKTYNSVKALGLNSGTTRLTAEHSAETIALTVIHVGERNPRG